MILVVLVGLSSLTFFNNQPTEVRTVDMPDNVKAVVDTKCFGCHNVESTNDKAKDKLLWDKLDDLSKAEFVSALGSIEEVLDEDEMPPAKFLEKKPEMKLTADEKMVLRDWAVATAEKMME
ncbi:MAG: heme-binding domain-containing protein [Cyclobacteriaceae bacterium]|nr:heme-binding domain-containing protein [Cyclobacteriaceae bacterium]